GRLPWTVLHARDLEVAVDLDGHLGTVGLGHVRLVGRPSASFSTRWTVPPGTAASAAALTLSAVSPVSSTSVMPLATWPPLVGSKLAGGCPLGGAGWAVDRAAVVDVDVRALAVPFSRAAP